MSDAGRCAYLPMMFRELPFYWTSNNNALDIACFQVAPMDEHGNFNLGPQVSDMWGVIRAAKTIIVEVNENMPIAEKEYQKAASKKGYGVTFTHKAAKK